MPLLAIINLSSSTTFTFAAAGVVKVGIAATSVAAFSFAAAGSALFSVMASAALTLAAMNPAGAGSVAINGSGSATAFSTPFYAGAAVVSVQAVGAVAMIPSIAGAATSAIGCIGYAQLASLSPAGAAQVLAMMSITVVTLGAATAAGNGTAGVAAMGLAAFTASAACNASTAVQGAGGVTLTNFNGAGGSMTAETGYCDGDFSINIDGACFAAVNGSDAEIDFQMQPVACDGTVGVIATGLAAMGFDVFSGTPVAVSAVIATMNKPAVAVTMTLMRRGRRVFFVQATAPRRGRNR